jgi:hypothetical protein
MTLAALKRILQPAGTQISAAALPPPSTGPVTRSRARPVAALAGGLLAAATSPSVERVQGNMPGPWSVDAVNAVASAAAQYVAGPVRAGLHAAAVLSGSGATRVVCCLVPGAYVCDAHVARSRWLGRLRAAGRLVFVPSAGPGLSPEPASVWLVAFATRADAQALLIESGPWRLAL